MKLLISILIIIVHVTIISSTKTSAPKCCENDKNLLIESECDVNEQGKRPLLSLKCPEKYILDPTLFEEDNYTITENGTLMIPDVILFHDEFCIVNRYDKDSDETSEIAIVCFPESEIPTVSFTLKAVFLIISIIFLLLTLNIYYLLPELRETQDKVMIFALICLTTFMFFLACLQLYEPPDLHFDYCLYMAVPTYFFTMAYFAWLNCVIINVWKIIVLRNWKINESAWYKMNHLYGWTVPALLTIGLHTKHHFFEPSIGVSSCWFHRNSDQWKLVYIPIISMLFINVIFCIHSAIKLKTNEYTPDTLRALRYKCILYVKIFLLGGFTWFLEVLSFSFNDHAPSAWIWIFADSLNCLHGVLVFCVLILWRQRIRKELANRKILCFTCPSKWANIEDEEQVCLENEGKEKYDLIIKAIK